MRFVFGVCPEGLAFRSGERYVAPEVAGAGAMSLEEVECAVRKIASAHRKFVVERYAAHREMYSGRYFARVELPCEACRARRAEEDAASKRGYPLYSPEKAARLARKCSECAGNGVHGFVSLVVEPEVMS